jgi:enoyl-CoA hydratase/carnithine racemase
MRTIDWRDDRDATEQLNTLVAEAAGLELLVIRFAEGGAHGSLCDNLLDDWITTRAVTVADVDCKLAGAALDVALACDLVYMRTTAVLDVGSSATPPTAGLVRAMANAERTALDRVFLDGGRIDSDEAVRLGLVHRSVAVGRPLPLPEPVSIAALTAARDLMRSSTVGEAGRALELATFRLVFAAGDPCEGARAFLERRQPRFSQDDE